MPVEFRAQRVGTHLQPMTAGDLAHMHELDEGKAYKIRAFRDRSKQHHRRFFGAISKAYENWPEDHDFQPESADHLRQWLECQAGHREHFDINLASAPEHIASEALIMATWLDGRFPFRRDKGSIMRVYKAKSIAWEDMDQDQFHRMAAPIEGMIESMVGVSVDDLFLQNEMQPESAHELA